MLICGALGLMTILYCLDSSDSIRWPAGTYGIPKPASKCPLTDGFPWEEGWVSQDTNGKNSNNSRSPEFNLAGIVDNTKVNRSFCIKANITHDSARPAWPQGQYCIYKYKACPTGLAVLGYVYWDDENTNNSNAIGGTVPGGDYGVNTRIRFCCKTDGDKNEPIILPTKTSFFLLAYNSSKCQMVKWATATLEWIYYDTEHDNNKDKRRQPYPYNAGVKHPTIYYCYYRGCNKTLTGLNGTFHSPNYPQKYPDGQYCSWRITVSPGQQIHLTFKDFSLQSENNTDSLCVYDGKNTTAEVLAVFYGRHRPPKEGIFSSSNHMLIIFKSDKNDSYTGFNALYCESICPETTTAPTTTEIPEMTSSPAFTLEKTTINRESTSTKGGAKNEQRGKTEGKGFDVVAVVVPVVVLVFLVFLVVAGFFFYKRRRKEIKEIPSVIYASPQVTSENHCYDRSMAQPPPSVGNPCYDRGFTIANSGCCTEPNEFYTELSLETMDKKETNQQPDNQYQSLNTRGPVYDTLEPGEATCNPIYDSRIRLPENKHACQSMTRPSENAISSRVT